MPGKHAPASPKSFYMSLARAGGILVAAIVVIVAIVIVATGEEKKPVARPSPSPSPTVAASPSPSQILGPLQVVVLNSTDRNGLAKAVATKLTLDGWIVKPPPGNAPTHAHTTIYVRHGAMQDAQRLKRTEFPFMSDDAIVEASVNDPGNEENAALTLVLGNDYPKTTSRSTPTPSP